jgi:hypothetical protein
MTKRAVKHKKKISARAAARAMFENIAEQEVTKGHHSNEGAALRLLSRGISGWLSRTLSNQDVYVLCDETLEQWLRTLVTGGPWSRLPFLELVARAVTGGWINDYDALRIVLLRTLRKQVIAGKMRPRETQVVAALRTSIQMLENYW